MFFAFLPGLATEPFLTSEIILKRKGKLGVFDRGAKTGRAGASGKISEKKVKKRVFLHFIFAKSHFYQKWPNSLVHTESREARRDPKIPLFSKKGPKSAKVQKSAAFSKPLFSLPALGMKKNNFPFLLRKHQECLSNRQFVRNLAFF